MIILTKNRLKRIHSECLMKKAAAQVEEYAMKQIEQR